MSAHLASIADLSDDITADARRVAEQVAESIRHLPAASLFGTEEGGVTFFWHLSESKLTVGVEPDGSIAVHALDENAAAGFQYVIFTEGEDVSAFIAQWL